MSPPLVGVATSTTGALASQGSEFLDGLNRWTFRAGHHVAGSVESDAAGWLGDQGAELPTRTLHDGFVAGQMVARTVVAGDDPVETIRALEGWRFDGPKGLQEIDALDHSMLQPMFAATGLELFQFRGAAPPPETVAIAGGLPHFAIEVGDTAQAFARIEALGGRRFWPEMGGFGRAQTWYALDPDGNLLELIDGSVWDVAAAAHELFPEQNPLPQTASGATYP